MNKRLEEMAEQCRYQSRDERLSRQGRGEYIESFDEEKFAELIIRECANYAFSDDRDHAEMLKHFGVEE